MMYDAGCGYNELKAVSDIWTLDSKIRLLERELEGTFNKIFNRVD
jgi:hypothetical protein